MSTDFSNQLRHHLGFIERSAAAYDADHVEEALRIAVSLRVLFHDTGRSVSLLKHLGIKRSALVLSTFQPGYTEDPKTGRCTGVFLPWLTFDRGMMKPPLETAARKDFISAESWWKEYVFCWDIPLTREDVVLAAANQDGGAHVDAKPGPKTESLKKSMGSVRPNSETPEIQLSDKHLPFIRQFAYEVLNSPGIVQAASSPSVGTTEAGNPQMS